MFTNMISELNRGTLPENDLLRKRFDFALTKKMAIVKLPPAFWTKDPKINPRSDHLFWASLLLMDRERIELALNIIAAEIVEEINPASCTWQRRMEIKVRGIIASFFEQIPATRVQQEMRRDLYRIIPEWIDDND
ncbi:MAG: hypothetical protein ACWGN1_05050 [Desulfobulbales bacterium]